MHNDFTVFKRRVPSGKKVVFYYAYEGAGVDTWEAGAKAQP
jgi:hypothetical protein